MPARSQSQQKLFGMALGNPSALTGSNKRLASLPQSTLRDFASTPRTGLPQKVKQPAGMKPPTPNLKLRMKPMAVHTGFRSVMSGDMPKAPGVRWR